MTLYIIGFKFANTLVNNSIMKRWILMLMMGWLSFSLVGCSDDDDNNNNAVAEVVTNLTSGTWRVGQYMENRIDKTISYDGYMFRFTRPNIVTATKNTDVFTGTWSVEPDHHGAELDIEFNTPPALAVFSEDWDVVNYSSTMITLADLDATNPEDTYLILIR
jgi:hypothetical protein